ncbi:MAG: XRE family transcriptional regulator [Gemmatimonadetes bacterium]|nr:XRE family transcriptional regulator [Gemmatimonadota bacterium]
MTDEQATHAAHRDSSPPDPETVVHEGSTNLWADLGRPDAEETFLRARLLSKVVDLLRELGLTRAGAAKRLGVTKDTASDILYGKLNRFSFDDLIAFLRALDHDVEFVVKPIVRDEAASLT